MKAGSLVMAKFMADVFLHKGGEGLSCRLANYAKSPPIAVFMFLMDLGASGAMSGTVRLVDESGDTTYWLFERLALSGVLEITQADNGFRPLSDCGLSNTHSDQRYLDNLGTEDKAGTTLGNSWGGGKA